MQKENISLAVYSLAGLPAGLLSFFVKDNMQAVLAMLALFLLSGFLIEKIIKEKKDLKWKLSNGGLIYASVWFIVWIVLYNL